VRSCTRVIPIISLPPSAHTPTQDHACTHARHSHYLSSLKNGSMDEWGLAQDSMGAHQGHTSAHRGCTGDTPGRASAHGAPGEGGAPVAVGVSLEGEARGLEDRGGLAEVGPGRCAGRRELHAAAHAQRLAAHCTGAKEGGQGAGARGRRQGAGGRGQGRGHLGAHGGDSPATCTLAVPSAARLPLWARTDRESDARAESAVHSRHHFTVRYQFSTVQCSTVPPVAAARTAPAGRSRPGSRCPG